MADQPPLPTSEDIWDALLNSEASTRYLREQAEKAEKLLDQDDG